MLAGLNLVKEGKVSFGYPLLILIILGSAFFLFSAITSVKALGFAPFNVSHPHDWVSNKDNRSVVRLKKPDKTQLLYRIIELNDYELNIRANYVSATLTGIRNGVILLSLASGVALLNLGNQITYTQTTSVKNPTSSITAEQDNSKGVETSPIQATPRSESGSDNINAVTNARHSAKSKGQSKSRRRVLR